ncbi:hypothetical protein PVAP13_5NG107281 [Panicum virgatum]|uniref:Uncharacterized protein n=1 Tax=Panicum virgatum TaxID=38727 RepID=A0A8T0RL28_PANVG|nr:hypothetical protein PVAP13_5NG107281 [Panicum virgatum]
MSIGILPWRRSFLDRQIDHIPHKMIARSFSPQVPSASNSTAHESGFTEPEPELPCICALRECMKRSLFTSPTSITSA